LTRLLAQKAPLALRDCLGQTELLDRRVFRVFLGMMVLLGQRVTKATLAILGLRESKAYRVSLVIQEQTAITGSLTSW
jgi:hypothetical protein